MHNLSRRSLLSMIGMAPLAGGILRAGAIGADMQADSRAARERIRRRYFPDVVLRTQDNKQVRFYEDLIKNKIVTINFFFAKCEDICPLVTSNLVKVQKVLGNRVGREIFMNSISLKPEQDSPAQLKAFAKM